MFSLFRPARERVDSAIGASSQPSRMATQDPASVGGTASRKQLLAVVLRETLLHGGVPRDWLAMEFFRTMDKAGARSDGIHVRLIVRDGHADLPARMVAIERDFRRRVGLVDYRAGEWLQGVSWQFDLPDDDEPAAVRWPRLRDQSRSTHTYASTQPAAL